MKKLILSLTIIAFIASGCDVTSLDEDINNNPNEPSQASPKQLISNAMLSLSGLSSSPQGEYNAQYLSETDYIDDSFYPENTTSFYWLYQGPLINLQAAINNSDDNNQIAVAKILRAYYFWHITDRWGDIPYSEALNGVENFTPTYDTQEDIYYSLFDSLKAAGQQLDTSGSLDGDIMYDGNIEKWRKFSNTVRLMMAMRLSEVAPQKAEQEFTDALDDGVMSSNEDSFVFRHLASETNENYWYNQVVRESREWWAISERFVQMLEPNNDPRLSVFADTTAADSVGTDMDGDGTVEDNEYSDIPTYRGLPYGTPNKITTANYSLLGADIHEQDAPVYLTTYAQVLFAKAEAAERNWTTESAATNYNDAIEASIVQWTGSDASVASYLSQPSVQYNPTNGLKMIANQRYIHLYMHGYEAWAEWRRTGYPDNMVNPQGNNVPLRQSYTSDEALNNTENYDEAVQRQFNGENSIYGKLWWDVD